MTRPLALIAARGEAAYARGVEDAAKVCDSRRTNNGPSLMNDPVALEHDMEAYLCAAAIRALLPGTARAGSGE
jgi:hypothetical protein